MCSVLLVCMVLIIIGYTYYFLLVAVSMVVLPMTVTAVSMVVILALPVVILALSVVEAEGALRRLYSINIKLMIPHNDIQRGDQHVDWVTKLVYTI